MPSASRRRARTYDPATVRSALVEQFGRIREAVHALTGEQLDAPTRLGDWTVRELVAHLASAADRLTQNYDAPVPSGARPLDLLGWVRGTRTVAAQVHDAMQESARAGVDLDASIDRFVALLPEVDPDCVFPISFGTIKVSDFLVTRLVETVVHADDLADAVGIEDFPHARQALAAVTRLLADALADQAPGGSVELRIPPFAVVQCVEGPRHTRGTPPNVVETSPLVWIRLATGRLTWKDALDVAQLTASGERSDLSGLLPVMG